MPERRAVIHTAFLLLLPLIVAAFGMSLSAALLLVIVALACRWAIVLLGFVRPAAGPELVLEALPPALEG